MKNFSLKLLLLNVLAVVMVIPAAYAGVSISINSVDGGSGIRFDRVLPGLKNTKQLMVRVSSNDGKKYQVFQRVLEPITNEKGQPLNLTAIEVVTLSSSNTSGTLYLQNADHLSMGEQLLYTSGQGGESDSFTIAYNASPEQISGGGSFRGRIVFTVRTLGGEQSESSVDFLLDSVDQLKISVAGAHDPKRIRIKDTDVSADKADLVKVSFSDNGSNEVKVYQEFIQPLTNETGSELPMDVLRAVLQGNGANIRSGDVSLNLSKTLLYSGEANQDEFAVYFFLDAQKIQNADAGLYKGQVKYTVDTGSSHPEFTIDIECNIQPVFTIDMTLPPEGISFGHVLASSPAQEKQVIVTVRSNLHKPYQVVQNLASLMTNEQGKEFDKKYFTFKVNLGNTQKGRTKYAEQNPVEVGDNPIYFSDAQGSSVTFSVTYQLQGYFEMSPGNFVAPLKFSLNQN